MEPGDGRNFEHPNRFHQLQFTYTRVAPSLPSTTRAGLTQPGFHVFFDLVGETGLVVGCNSGWGLCTMLVVDIINRCDMYSEGTRNAGVTMQSTLLVLVQNVLGTQKIRNSFMLIYRCRAI